MFNSLFVFAALVVFAGILFLLAVWVERKSAKIKQITNSGFYYALTLAVFASSWAFYGSVGSAANNGLLFLTVYLGPTIAIITWWFILRRLVRIKSEYRITSIADLISTRYGKSNALAALATLVSVFGTIPYIALQLKAINSTFVLIGENLTPAGKFLTANIGTMVVVLMILLAILFGSRRLVKSERNNGLMAVLGLQAIIKLLAFMSVGAFVTYILNAGWGDIFDSIEVSSFADIMYKAGTGSTSLSTWITYLVLSMSAVLFLPYQFHVAVVENSNEKQIRTAMWLFPLYMLLISLFVIPIAGVGLLQGLPASQGDNFVLLLPIRNGLPGLALFVFLGGFSAAMGMIIVASMTSAIMVTNHLVRPVVQKIKFLRFFEQAILQIRWLTVIGVVLLGFAFQQLVGSSYTLLNMGIISFVAVLQFAPSIIGGLFWARGNKAGALWGMLAGFALWAYTMLVPAFVRGGQLPSEVLTVGPFGIGFFNPERFLGLSGLQSAAHGVFWSMIFNIGFYVLGSLYFAQTAEERQRAHEFVKIMTTRFAFKSIELGQAKVNYFNKRLIFEDLLRHYLSPVQIRGTLEMCAQETKLQGKEYITVVELANFKTEVEKLLALSIGTAPARKALSQAAIFTPDESRELSEVYATILAGMQLSPEELQRRMDFFRERDRLLSRQAANLEVKVQERTRQLVTASDISRIAASTLDLDQLIRQVVDMVREHFNLYHVGLYLLDEQREFAILRAGNGQTGRMLVEQGYRVRISEGMVGWAIRHEEWRVTGDITQDALRIGEREFPDTRSEAAIPLRSRNQVIGAINIHSTHSNAFDEDFLRVIQTIADQVAITIDNAHLVAQTQKALEAERRAYGEISRDAWLRILRARRDWGFKSDEGGVQPVSGEWSPGLERAAEEGQTILSDDASWNQVSIPLRVQNQVVGAMTFRKAREEGIWAREEIAMLEKLTEQLSVAVDSARLYRETQQRAERERLQSEIVSKIRQSTNVDIILQTAIQEITDALKVPQGKIVLHSGDGGHNED